MTIEEIQRNTEAIVNMNNIKNEYIEVLESKIKILEELTSTLEAVVEKKNVLIDKLTTSLDETIALAQRAVDLIELPPNTINFN